MYQPATQEQKNEMVTLSNSPQITPFEKTKVFRDLNKLSSERASVMIARLKKWAVDRRPHIPHQHPMSKQLAPIMRGYVRKSNHSLYGPCWNSECRQPTHFFAEKPFIDRHELQHTRSQAINWAVRAAHELQRP